MHVQVLLSGPRSPGREPQTQVHSWQFLRRSLHPQKRPLKKFAPTLKNKAICITNHPDRACSTAQPSLPPAPLRVRAVVAKMARGVAAGGDTKIAVGVAACSRIVHRSVGMSRTMILAGRRMSPHDQISRRRGSRDIRRSNDEKSRHKRHQQAFAQKHAGPTLSKWTHRAIRLIRLITTRVPSSFRPAIRFVMDRTPPLSLAATLATDVRFFTISR